MQEKNRLSGVLGVEAFTLIELLVVVLIIGILAAVALPQYQKAVWKSRFVQAKTMANSIAQAEEVYYLANGKYTKDIDELNIDVPAINCTSGGVCYFPWGHCLVTVTYDFLRCYVNKNENVFLQYDHWLEHSPEPGSKHCVAFSTNMNDLGNQICKSETGLSSGNVQTNSVQWHY